MQLDNVSVAIRPRKDWEAIDLGFRMVQQWWQPVYKAWLITTLPFALIIYGALWGHPLLAAFIIWLCKPLYERIPLYIVSRRVFGETPTLSQTLKALPKLWLVRFIPALTIYRFDLGRSFNWPIQQLEGLKGKNRRERARVLQKQTMGTAVNLTIACFLFEVLLTLSLIGMIMLFIPGHLLQRYFLDFFTGSNPLVAQYIITGSILFAHLVIGPFYSAAGFALYINRRTQLEGWDIEIAFRRIATRTAELLRPTLESAKNRSRHVTVMLFAIFLVGSFSMPGESQAKTSTNISNAEAKQIITEVKSAEEFGTKKKEMYWRKKQPDEKDKKKEESDVTNMDWLLNMIRVLSQLLGVTTQALIWIAALALIAILAIAFFMWLPNLNMRNRETTSETKTAYLFGMEVSPESLPDDLAKTAMQLISEGKLHAAVSLLYRGALSHFIHNLGINLKGSATEGDCIRTVTRKEHNLSTSTLNFFQLLTFNWQLIAYAQRPPDIQTLQTLCQEWTQHFKAQT